MKEGASEKIHIDWNESKDRYTVVFTVGDHTDGDFCVPQLNMRVPLHPGSVLFARTRLLAHCATVGGTGRRLVFTCFTDHALIEEILKGHDLVVV
jgi:hypothetical protein